MRTRQWLVFATLAATVMFLVSAVAQEQGQVREISITGTNYAFSPASVQVNKNDVVKITFTAKDIAHSFTIEEYRIEKRAGAGQTVSFEFRADRPGQFTFYCNLSQDAKCREMKGILAVR
jgi:heme/copper-type cytochrome/quinol oxidase subunit 2